MKRFNRSSENIPNQKLSAVEIVDDAVSADGRNTPEPFPEIIFSFLPAQESDSKRRLSNDDAIYENGAAAAEKPPKSELHYASTPMLLNCDQISTLTKSDTHKSELKIFVTKSNELSAFESVSYDLPKPIKKETQTNIYNDVLYAADTVDSTQTVSNNNNTVDEIKTRIRRATLMRNEIIPFYTVQKGVRNKKVRLTRTWKDIKGWIGTEKVKLNRIIKNEAAKQRLHWYDDNISTENEESSSDSPRNIDQRKRDSLDSKSSDIPTQKLLISEPILLAVNCEEVSSEHDENCDFSSIVSEFDFKSVSETSIPKKGLLFQTPNTLVGQNGFEELRRYVKQGGDFGKELSTILQERSDAELQYAKSLSKLGSKLSKICRVNVGSCTEAWRHISQEMDQQAEIHRQYSTNLAESIIKPLKQMTDSQHKLRKQIETNVEKTSRCLTDWRTAEAKSKKQSHSAARENEKLQDPVVEARMVRSPSLAHITHNHVVNNIRPERHSTVTPPSPSNGHTDKEAAKIQLKKRKAEDAVKKADEEYYTLCVRAERSRLDWESTILRGAGVMEQLEEERLHSLKSTAEGYLKISSSLAPQTAECIQRLTTPVSKADPESDMKAIRGVRGAPQAGTCEQLLPDFYCEHITLAMNRERRKQALMKIMQLIKHDIEKERKSKQGLEKLSKAIKDNPNFGTDDSQMNVTEKMYHMRSMLTYLEAARYKITSALCELENRPKNQHPLAAHIQVTRDKQGLQQSLLKIPSWLQTELQVDKPSSPIHFTQANIDLSNRKPSIISEKIALRKQSTLSTPPLPPDSPLDWTDRGDGDGVSIQPDSDFDEFSSQEGSCGDVTDATNSVITSSVIIKKEIVATPELKKKPIGKCKALYNYTPNLYDELKLSPGDIINIFEKQEDGWWCGDLNGTVGIFPATYVEEFA